MSADPPKSSWRSPAAFRLGDWDVLPASGELRGRRGVQRLRPLLMDILLRLAAEPGQVVRREALLEEVWTRRMVNDEVLSRAMAELRTALGDDPRNARYIETLPKIGYRLVAEPAALAATPAQAAPAPATAPRRTSKSLAVGTALVVLALSGIGFWTYTARREPPPPVETLLAGARVFTSDPALELSPRFSPDGRQVAYALGEGVESRIVVQALDGSTRQFIGSGAATRISPVFFPDGRRIAYWRSTRETCAIVDHELASGAERELLDCALSPRPRFDLSPDGKHLAFSAPSRAQHPAGLWLLELGRGAPRALTTPQPGAGDDLFPRFSPDGRRIAFFRGNASHRQAWVLDIAEPAGARVASKADGLGYGLAWMGPEGPLLAAADWYGFRALNVVDPKTGEGRLVGARGARFPDVSPRGDIVWENAVYAANLWRVGTTADAAPRVLWRSTRYSNQPDISPDGRSVAFSSNRDGHDAIYAAPLEGEARRIAASEQHRYMRPHWAADGRSVLAVRIAMDAKGRSAQEAVRIRLDGSQPQVIAALGTTVNDVRESADGRWLVWGEISGNAMRLMRAPAAEPARGERLPWPLVSQYQMNRTHAVLAQPQMKRLSSCRLDTLACEPIAIDVEEVDLYHWTLGPRSLFLRASAQGGPRIVRYDLASRRFGAPIAFAPAGTGTSLAASPDESMILVVREEGPQIDLMVAKVK